MMAAQIALLYFDAHKLLVQKSVGWILRKMAEEEGQEVVQ
jgi:3-methyladenine DNA glycosylase AlkD